MPLGHTVYLSPLGPALTALDTRMNQTDARGVKIGTAFAL